MSPRRPNIFEPSDAETKYARLPQKNPPRKFIETGPSFSLKHGFSPVILSSSEVTVNPGSGIAVPDHGLLQPVERTAMLVDEIHFNVRADDANGNYVDPGWPLRAKISMGQFNVTNNFVPIGGLEYSYLINSMYGSRALASTDFAGDSFSGIRWKLPVPLYVPAGSLLYTELQMSSYFYVINTTMAVAVSYIGRLLPVDYPVPKTIKVPFATSIVSPDVDAPPVITLLQSKDLQLGNPFDTNFYAQRMTMRNYGVIGSVLTEAWEGGAPIVTLRGTFDNVDINVANLLSHYVVFDDGFTANKFGTMGHHVYNLFNLDMQPKDRFDLLINWQDTNYTSTFPVGVAALIGWRNEAI